MSSVARVVQGPQALEQFRDGLVRWVVGEERFEFRLHCSSAMACWTISSGRWLSPLLHSQAHGGAQDASGLPRQSLGGLTQDFHARVGEQGVLGAGGFESVLDEQGAKRSRSMTGASRTRTWMRLCSAAYGAPVERLCLSAGWPTSHTLMRSRESKAKFRKAGKSRKNSGGRFCASSMIHSGVTWLGVDEFVHALLDVAPQLRAAVAQAPGPAREPVRGRCRCGRSRSRLGRAPW